MALENLADFEIQAILLRCVGSLLAICPRVVHVVWKRSKIPVCVCLSLRKIRQNFLVNN